MGAKVSSVTITITEADIMANIREFIDVDGLSILSCEFKDKSIEIKGSYKKLIDIPFLVRIRVEDVHSNKIRIIIEKIQALKIGVPNGLLMTGLNFAKKKLEPFGVSINGKEIIVDADVLLEKVDHVHLLIDNILMVNGVLAIKVSAISADIKAMKAKGEDPALNEEEFKKSVEAEERKATFRAQLTSMEKPQDVYQEIREDLKEKVPQDYRIFYEYGAAIPDIIALAIRVIKDNRVLKKDKIIIGATCGYFLSPIDILPDKFPFVGRIDDLALFSFGVYHLLTRIPYPIVVEHWSGDIETLALIKNNMDKLANMVGAGILNKIYSFIEKPLNSKFGMYKDDGYYMVNRNNKGFKPPIMEVEEDLIRPVETI